MCKRALHVNVPTHARSLYQKGDRVTHTHEDPQTIAYSVIGQYDVSACACTCGLCTYIYTKLVHVRVYIYLRKLTEHKDGTCI